MNPLLSFLGSGGMGVLGSLATGVAKIYTIKIQNEHEREMEKLKRETIAVTQAGQLSIENVKSFTASYEVDKATYWQPGAPAWMAIIEFGRGVTRWGATWHYILAVDVIGLAAFNLVNLTDSVWLDIATLFVYTTFNFCGLCLGWFFGKHQLEKSIPMLRSKK